MWRRILGVAGAGAAISVLQACGAPGAESSPDPESDQDLDEASGALATSTLVRVFDSVQAMRTTNLTFNAANPRIAVLQGFTNPGDGGGGVFYATAGTGVTDDGGLVFVTTTTTKIAWRRIYSGAVDIRWFGASLGAADNAAAIQKTFDTVRAFSRGGAVYVPAGDWLVSSGLSILTPEVPGLYDPPGFTIRGDGPEVSRIQSNTLPFGTALLDIVGPHKARNITIEGLSLWRPDNVDSVLRHSADFTLHVQSGNRLDHCTLRNVQVILGPTLATGNFGNATAIKLENVSDWLIENLHAQGGAVTLYLGGSSRCTVIGYRAPLVDGASFTGLFIEGGGLHHLISTRLENCGSTSSPGTGLKLKSTTLNRIDTLSFEGSKTTNAVVMDACTAHVFTNAQLTPPYTAAGNAVTITNSSMIRFIGGSIGQGGSSAVCNSNTCMAISMAGCSDVSFEGVRTSAGNWEELAVGLAGSAVGVPPNEEFAAYTTRFHASFVDNQGRAFGTPTGDIYIDNATIDPGGFERWRVRSDGVTLARIEDSLAVGVNVFDGQRITLLGSGPNGVTISGSDNLRLGQGSSTVLLGAASSISFMYDRGTRTWIETARSLEP